jgi:hypothetical protein
MESHETLEGYPVLDVDESEVGVVVDRVGDMLIVERGHLRRHRYGLPEAFVQIDVSAHALRTTLSKRLIEESPGVDHGRPPDIAEIARYYGLAEGYGDPPTKGDGMLNPDDPAETADQLAERLGLQPPEAQRAAIREGREDVYGPPGRPIHPPDPHVTGEPRPPDER